MNASCGVIVTRIRIVVRFIILIIINIILDYIELGMPALIIIVLIFSIIVRLVRLTILF